MNITKSALQYNRVTYLALLIVVVLGMQAYFSLPRDSMPPFTIRVASVVTNFPGASPERVETLITEKIEKVAQELPEVDFISSTSRTGISIISVSLKDDTPAEKLQAVWDRLRRKIETIQDDLPSGIKGPTVKDEDIGVTYGIFVGFEFDGFSYAEQESYAEALRDEIIVLEDAAKVEIGGIIEERIYIEYNDAELARLGVTASQIQNTISATNIIIPAGQVNLGEERISLEATGNLESVEEIAGILIPIGQTGQSLPLGEITTVRRDYVSPRESIVKINGQNSLAIFVSLKEKSNIIKLGKDIDKVLESYNRTLPIGIKANRISSQDLVVEKSVNNFINNVIQSILIVLVVVFIFLGLRAGLVISSIIPGTIVATFLLMNLFDTGMNQVTLAGLIMALGLLVDNGIVMTESILERMEKGESKLEACVNSCKEFMVPLLISSLTTSAAFLSFYLAESVLGEMMGKLFIIITISLLSSWVMAFTLVPLLAMLIFKTKKKMVGQKDAESEEGHGSKGFFGLLMPYYNKLLHFCMSRPLITILAILVLFGLSLFGFTKIPFVFMPDSDRNLVTMDINLPLGTSIETTTANVELVEGFIRDSLLVDESRSKGVADWSSYIGVGPNSYDLGYSAGEQNSGYAHLLLNTSDMSDNQMVIDRMERFCIGHLPDATVSVKRLGSGGGASVPVQIRISGQDSDELMGIAASVKDKLHSIPGTKNIDDNWGPKLKKFRVQIDQGKLNQSGLTNQDIALSLSTVLSGKNIGEYREGDHSIPISMQVEGNAKLNFSDLETLSVFAQSSGKNIPLAQVAEILPVWEYSKILRRDLIKNITVNSSLVPGLTASEVTSELVPWLEEESKTWNPGYKFEMGGESESSSDAMGAVIAQLPISAFLMILLLVIQFNSARKTSIILSTIPLGLIGIVGGLLLTGENFSFTAFLGIISLAGIIINDGIVLLDKIQTETNSGKRSPFDAILKAANDRFNPILLTTFTTSFGMIPLWIGGGDMWRPMAISIIFGLFFGTVILLLFVPVLYKTLFRIKKS